MTTAGIQAGDSIPAHRFAELKRRTIFECCKWDPQVGDVDVLAPFPLVLSRSEWTNLCRIAERLAAETLAVEAELIQRRELHQRLGFTAALSRLFARGVTNPEPVRVMRFDFHPTPDGWQISEVNSDVPGGFVEASGFSSLMAGYAHGLVPAGDPTRVLTAAIAQHVVRGSTIALLHATAFTDDRQVMVHLARHLEAAGLRPILVAPDHVRWRNGQPFIAADWFTGKVEFLFRFFPAEWLPSLPRFCGWKNFFCAATPQCNPPSALLTQNKRWPLLQPWLETPIPEWKRVLPETRDPRDVDFTDPHWVLKPALGRVGDMVTIHGISHEKDLRAAHRFARRHPELWIAQRRFDCLPLPAHGRACFPCIGVFVINGRAAGAYGRIAARPLIDHNSQDIAVLVSRPSSGINGPQPEPVTHDTVGLV